MTAIGVTLGPVPRAWSAEPAATPAPTAQNADPATAPAAPTPAGTASAASPAAAGSPAGSAEVLSALPVGSSSGSESAPDIATMDFVPTTAQFTIVKQTAVYVSASADSPQMYPLPPGVGVQATEQSKDGKWLIALTEDGQAAFLPAEALGPFQPDAKPAIPVLTETVKGSARVLDTATLSVDGQPIILSGLVGETGVLADQLQKQITASGSNVTCQLQIQTYQCMLPNGADIARLALYNGAARPAPDASDDYRQQAESAKAGHRGLWK